MLVVSRLWFFFSQGQKAGQHLVLAWRPFQSAVGNERLPGLSGQESASGRGKPVVNYDYAVYFRGGRNQRVSGMPVQVSIAAEHEYTYFRSMPLYLVPLISPWHTQELRHIIRVAKHPALHLQNPGLTSRYALVF